MAIEDYANIINGVMWTQVVLAAIFIGARIYTRYFIIRSIGWDDIIMGVNLVTLIAFVISTSIGVTYGVGKKAAVVPAADYKKAIMWEAIGQGICIMGIAASKGAVALFLLRIVVHRWHIVLLRFCIISTTILCTITTIMLYAQCKPMAFLWDRTIEGGVCWLAFTDLAISTAAWSAAMDFVFAILPWHVIMGLNMKRKEKLTVACGLSLGAFAGICSVIRTYELQSLSSQAEYVYDTVPMLLWSTTEIMATIICACIPVLRPLYVKLMYGSRGSSNGHSYPLQSDYGNKRRRPSNGFPNLTDMCSKDDGCEGEGAVYAGPTSGALKTTVQLGSDCASEESILRDRELGGAEFRNFDVEGMACGGITRTYEIVVETSSATETKSAV